MKTKVYRALQLDDALAEIKAELGDDALIVSSRQVRSGKGLKGLLGKREHELVVAYDEQKLPAPRRRTIIPDTQAFAQLAAFTLPPSQERQPAPLDRVLPTPPEKAPPTRELPSLGEIQSTPRRIHYAPALDLTLPAYNPAAPEEDTPLIADVTQLARKTLQASSTQQAAATMPVARAQIIPAASAAHLPTFAAPTTQLDEKAPVPAATLDSAAIAAQSIAQAPAKKGSPLDPPAPPSSDAQSQKLDEIRQLLQDFSDRFDYVKIQPQSSYSPVVEALCARLIRNGVHPDIAHELSRKTQKLAEGSKDSPLALMRAQLLELIGPIECIDASATTCRKVLLLGPTGVGKTTTVAKLAVEFARRQRLRVALVNTDVSKPGAPQQLSGYTSTMHLPMLTVSGDSSLSQAIEQFAGANLVLVDTAGRVAGNPAYQQEVEKMLQSVAFDEIYLTLCSGFADRVTREIIQRYAFLPHYRIIATKTDEDTGLGSLINLRKYSQQPLSYLTHGQTVPDDISPVDPTALAEAVLRPAQQGRTAPLTPSAAITGRPDAL